MSEHAPKLAIVGAGSVGATIAYAAMMRGVAKQIAIYDVDEAKVTAEVLDLNHGLQFVPMATIEGSSDVAVCADATVVVVTAGARQRPGQTRMDLAAANARICREMVPKLVRQAPNAILLVVTNPCDVMTYVTLKLSGLPSGRVLGSGTVLDSSRFRYLIARRCGVAVQNVHAYIAGEHGDSEIPLWSTANIASIPVAEWRLPGQGVLSAQDREAIFEGVRTAAYEIIRGKGATNYAIGLATSKIVEALMHDERRVLPVSSLLTGHRGIDDVCLSLPTIVGREGAEAVLDVPLSEEEIAGLRRSAETIRASIRQLGF
jgi:L-lactate dehydrogenase